MQQSGGLRESMPGVAGIVDDLRRELGVAWANRIVAGGMKGSRGFYAWEVGPDGVLRDVGSSIDGARVRLVDGKLVMRPMPGLAALSDARAGVVVKPVKPMRSNDDGTYP